MIDRLPKNIKEEINQMIYDGQPIYGIKQKIEENHKGKSDMFPISYNTYKHYAEARKADIIKQVELNDAIIEDTKRSTSEIADCVKNSLEDIKNGKVDFDNTRQNFTNLYETLQKRVKILEAAQGKVIFDSHLESVILGYKKEARALLEASSKIADQMKDNFDVELLDTLKEITYAWGQRVFSVCKKIYGDDPKKNAEFERLVLEGMEEHLTDYYEANVARKEE